MSAPVIIGGLALGAYLLSRGKSGDGGPKPGAVAMPESEAAAVVQTASGPVVADVASTAGARVAAQAATAPKLTTVQTAPAPSSGSKLAVAGSAPAGAITGSSAQLGADTGSTSSPEWVKGYAGFVQSLTAATTVKPSTQPRVNAELFKSGEAAWRGLVW